MADPAPTATASTPSVADPTPAATSSAPVTANAPATDSTGNLPETAGSLPLLGLAGLGLLAMGLVIRRFGTN